LGGLKVAKVFFGFKLEPFDQVRLKELAAKRGKRPATLVREAVERMLDAAEAVDQKTPWPTSI
jgi:predicted DNA-binding protein